MSKTYKDLIAEYHRILKNKNYGHGCDEIVAVKKQLFVIEDRVERVRKAKFYQWLSTFYRSDRAEGDLLTLIIDDDDFPDTDHLGEMHTYLVNTKAKEGAHRAFSWAYYRFRFKDWWEGL